MNGPPPYDVAFSARAGKDLREIRRYLRQNTSHQIARKVMSGLFDAIESLQDHPERYPPEPLLADYGNYRVIRKGVYKIYYEFTGFDVYICRVVHSKRDLYRILRHFKP